MDAGKKAFMGIDIHGSRGCCFAAIGDDGSLLESGWFSNLGEQVPPIVRKFTDAYDVSVGIDAPRKPLASPRKWYWDRNKWRQRRPSEKGYGRHCEIVVKAHGIANPQFTPLKSKAPTWMITGFAVFSSLQGTVPVYEVFPTASYALLQGITDVRVCIDFSACKPGPKDMFDAFVAAVTVREFVCGRGTAVGGGDGLGKIVLPRPLRDPVIKGVLFWPED
jgi:predicted nuclease with RNAse H fold